MAGGLPAVSGKKLIKLILKDGWVHFGANDHGLSFYKNFPSGKRITCIQDKSRSLAPSTLAQILGPKQTGLGRKGLLRLLAK